MNRDNLLLKLRVKYLHIEEVYLKSIMHFIIDNYDPPFANELTVKEEYQLSMNEYCEKHYTEGNGFRYAATELERLAAVAYAGELIEKLKKKYKLNDEEIKKALGTF